MPNLTCVHVGGRLWRGPACRAFARLIGLTAWPNAARVVEVHDGLEAFEIAVVAIGLHEFRIGPLVHVAQRWHPYSRLVIGRERSPSLIDARGLAEQMA